MLLPLEHRFVESVVKGRGSNPHIQVPRHWRAGGTESTRRTHSSERLAWAGGSQALRIGENCAELTGQSSEGVVAFVPVCPRGDFFLGLRKDSEEDFGLGIIG